MWEINEEFLKAQTDARKTIIFSHSPHEYNYLYSPDGKKTALFKEKEFLTKHDYIISTTVNADGYYYAVPKN